MPFSIGTTAVSPPMAGATSTRACAKEIGLHAQEHGVELPGVAFRGHDAGTDAERRHEGS